MTASCCFSLSLRSDQSFSVTMPNAQLEALIPFRILKPEVKMKSSTSGIPRSIPVTFCVTFSVRISEAPSGSWTLTKNAP